MREIISFASLLISGICFAVAIWDFCRTERGSEYIGLQAGLYGILAFVVAGLAQVIEIRRKK